MVKKLAFVGAGIAAVLIAASPLAFATEEPGHHGGHQDTQTSGDKSVIGDVNSPSQQTGLVNVGDVNALNGTNVCPDVGVAAGLLGGALGDTDDKGSIACNSLSGNNNDD